MGMHQTRTPARSAPPAPPLPADRYPWLRLMGFVVAMLLTVSAAAVLPLLLS